ncbi:Sensor histidine kinase RcsC [bioreactor metagenome]|uniref:Sensor histidine kinase RcsC n=1 Tax=bioreactor metagenome TaxID=1076179 RepID=A0A645BHK9_9ZZZZ
MRYEGNVYQLLAQPILSPSGALLYIIISLSGLEGVLSADMAADLPSWPAAAPETTTAVKPLHPIRNILLVDDAEAHLKIAIGMLKSMGYAVTGTADGATALKLFATESFDAVLTDLWMPGMSGEMLARELRKCPGGMECRIYAITADPDTAGDFDAEYFDGMTTKPLTIGALRQLLSN